MSIDSLLRAIGALTCVYTIGLFVSVTSTAALNAVAFDSRTLCADRACHAIAEQHHTQPGPATTYTGVIHTAALFLAGGE